MKKMNFTRACFFSIVALTLPSPAIADGIGMVQGKLSASAHDFPSKAPASNKGTKTGVKQKALKKSEDCEYRISSCMLNATHGSKKIKKKK